MYVWDTWLCHLIPSSGDKKEMGINSYGIAAIYTRMSGTRGFVIISHLLGTRKWWALIAIAAIYTRMSRTRGFVILSHLLGTRKRWAFMFISSNCNLKF